MRERAGERSCAAAACAVRVGAERHSDRSAFSPGQADPPRFQRACCSASRSSRADTWNCAPAPFSCEHLVPVNFDADTLSHPSRWLEVKALAESAGLAVRRVHTPSRCWVALRAAMSLPMGREAAAWRESGEISGSSARPR